MLAAANEARKGCRRTLRIRRTSPAAASRARADRRRGELAAPRGGRARALGPRRPGRPAVVLAVVAGLVHRSTRCPTSRRAREANAQAAIVQRSDARERRAARAAALAQRSGRRSQRDARALGMVQAGERPYVVTGLPKH